MVTSFLFDLLIQLSHPLSSLQLAGEGGDDGEIEDEEDDEDGDGDGELQVAGKAERRYLQHSLFNSIYVINRCNPALSFFSLLHLSSPHK